MSICAALVYIQKDGLCFGSVTFNFFFLLSAWAEL